MCIYTELGRRRESECAPRTDLGRGRDSECAASTKFREGGERVRKEGGERVENTEFGMR